MTRHILKTSRNIVIIEFVVLCILIPGLIIGMRLAPLMFAFLWAATGYCWLVLRRTDKNLFKNIWNFKEVNWSNLKPLLLRWILASIGMCLFLLWYDPERLFVIWREYPMAIPAILVGYPILSALPQELIFCSFFFSRYQALFKNEKLLILASALTFGYAHCLYINPVAPPLTFIGGLIFAGTYAKTKSLALVTIEHSLYGISLFLIGLGWYFFSGAVPV